MRGETVPDTLTVKVTEVDGVGETVGIAVGAAVGLTVG